MRALLVGESNPHSADPRLALHPLPRHAAGGRLAAILGLTTREYLRAFRRVNLCRAAWSTAEATSKAGMLSSERPMVLLGARVARAFGYAHEPFSFPARGILLLPHPSGRCRYWNDPEACVSARMMVRSLLQEEGGRR